jgi:hypothetical protein
MSQAFLDTGFVITLINKRDQYHQKALDLADREVAILEKSLTYQKKPYYLNLS